MLGLQHTSLICVYLVLIPIITKAAAAPHEVMVSAVSLGMIALAAAAVLQALRAGPFGSGYLARLPGAEKLAARCNPVNAPAGCRNEWLELKGF